MLFPVIHKCLSKNRNCTESRMFVFRLALFLWIYAGQAATSFYQNPTWPGFAHAHSSNADSKVELVTQELRYHAPGAREVYLVWGINGLQPVPEAIRPPGTYLDNNKVMRTRMVHAGDAFTATLRIP